MKQKDFFPKGSKHNPKPDFGGGNSHTTHPKTKRSFSSKHALHITMRSSVAVGKRSMLASGNKSEVDRIVRASAKTFHITLRSFVIVGSHLHLVLFAPARVALSNFLRTISALIARHIMGAQRGNPLQEGVRFWQARPFSRIITWGRQFNYLVKVYMMKNRLEAVGFATPAARFYAEINRTY